MYRSKKHFFTLNLIALGLVNCMHLDEAAENGDSSRPSAVSSARVKTKMNIGAHEDLTYIANSNGTVYVKTTVLVPNGTIWDVGTFGNYYGQYLFGDMNGDSKAEMLYANPDNNTILRRFNGTINTDPGATPVFAGVETLIASNAFGHLSGGGRYLVGDVDGDGKDDLAFAERANQSVYVKKSAGTTLAPPSFVTSNFGATISHYLLKDVNADGKDDLLLIKDTPSSVWAKTNWSDANPSGWTSAMECVPAGSFGSLASGMYY